MALLGYSDCIAGFGKGNPSDYRRLLIVFGACEFAAISLDGPMLDSNEIERIGRSLAVKMKNRPKKDWVWLNSLPIPIKFVTRL